MAQNLYKAPEVSNYDLDTENRLESLQKLRDLSPDKFQKLIELFGDDNTKNQVLLSKYFSESGKNLMGVGEMLFGIKNMTSESDMSGDLQRSIVKIFLDQLYNKVKGTDDEETFIITFGEADRIKDDELNFKSLQKKIGVFDENIVNSIKISNNQVFASQKIDILLDFQNITPAGKKLMCELVCREVEYELKNAKQRATDMKQNITDSMLPNNNLLKNLKLNDDMQRVITDLNNEIYKAQEQDDTKKIEELNKRIWKMYLLGLEKTSENQQIIVILKKLLANNFNFQALDPSEKTILARKSLSKNIENKFLEDARLDAGEYEKFLDDLYDFSKPEEKKSINIGDKTINLTIKKDFEGGEHKQFQNFENFKNMGCLPFSFEVNFDENDEDVIDLLEDKQNILFSGELARDGVINSYDTADGSIRLGNNYEIELNGQRMNRSELDKRLVEDDLPDEDKLSDEDLLKSKIKILSRSIRLDGSAVNKLNQLYILSNSGGEKLLSGKKEQNPKFLENGNRKFEKGTEGQEKGETYAQYIIEKIKENMNEEDGNTEEGDEDLSENDYITDEIVQEAKKYYEKLNEEGKNVFDEELRKFGEEEEENNEGLQEDIESLLDELRSQVDDDEDESKPIEEKGETPEQAWEKQREKVKKHKDCNFEDGTRLYFKNLFTNEIELPPAEKSDTYYVYEICDVSGGPGNGTFSLREVGDEYDAKESGGTVHKGLPMTGDQLGKMLDNTIYAMPKRTDKSWVGSMNRVKDSGIVSKMTTFGDMEGQVTFDGSKFVDKDNKEVKYFNRVEDSFDPDTGKQGKEISKYEIKKIDKAKGTVTLASKFDGHQDNNGNIEKVKYKYENEMSFEQFIVFAESKKLKGYNDEQQKEIETNYDVKNKGALANRGWFKMASIGNLIDIIKGTSKAFGEKMKADREEQKEALENFMFSQEGLNLNHHLGNILSLGGTFGSIKDAFSEMEIEYYNARDEKIWKKIDKWYKHYSSDPVYPAEYKTFLLDVMRGGNDRDRDRYKFAAAVLMMLKKEGPYPRDFKNKIGEGFWVEAFLGPNHKTRFQNFYEKKKQEINQVKDMGYSSGVRLKLMEDLNKMEFQYIISVIDGAAPYSPNSEDENTWKSIWGSKKLKDELQANLDGYFNSMDTEKQSIKTFWQGEEAYLRTVGAGRFNKALPALQVMCEKASTPGEIFRLKGYLMAAMLMGVINNNSTADTYKSFWKTARAMGFGPMFWVRDPNHPEKVMKLLEGVSTGDEKIGDFSKYCNFNLNDFTPPGIEGNYTDFNKNFGRYWNAYGKQILQYIENPVYGEEKSLKNRAADKNDKYSPIFADILKFNNDDDPGNTNDAVGFINYMKVAPLTATGNLIGAYIPKDGGYQRLKKEEDKSDAKDFWKSVSSEISKGLGDIENVEYYLQYFYNILDDYIEVDKFIRVLPLIKHLKERGEQKMAEYIWWYAFTGNIHLKVNGSFPDEFNQCIKIFSKMFFDGAEKIADSKSMVKSVFGDEYVHYLNEPYKMVNRNDWSKNMGGDDSFDTKGGTFKSTLRKPKYNYGEYDTINYVIKDLKKRLKNKNIEFERLPIEVKNSTLNLSYELPDEDAKFVYKGNNEPIENT